MEQTSTADICQQSSAEEFGGASESNECEETTPHLEGPNNTNTETSPSQTEEDDSVQPHVQGASFATQIRRNSIEENSDEIYQESDKDIQYTHNEVTVLKTPELDEFPSNNKEDIDNSSKISGKGIQSQETNPFLDTGVPLLLAKYAEHITHEKEMTSSEVTHEVVYTQTPEQSNVPDSNSLKDDHQYISQETNTPPYPAPPITPITPTTPTEFFRQVSQPGSPSRKKSSKEKIHVFTYGLSGAGKSSVAKLLASPGGFVEDDQDQYVFVTKDESICMETTPSTFLKSLTQFRNAYRKQKERYDGVKHVVLMVIMKGRITDEIKTITKKEIAYLTNPNNPVILCVTGCDTDTDLQWWKGDGNYKEFEKYHLKFGRDRVVSGCAVNTSNIKEEFREDFEKRRQKFRKSLAKKIGDVAKPMEPKSSFCPLL